MGRSVLRRILYITGTRADYGLMRRTLRRIHDDPKMDLGLCVTGMHLDPRYGMTVHEIEADGIPIIARVPVVLDDSTPGGMVHAISDMQHGITDVVSGYEPDIVIVLGDRGEMLAAAVSTLHLNRVIVHIHGGERTGTVDEPVRHAISKLSHYHLVTTNGARERLIRMGENPAHVHVVGAPGLDEIREMEAPERDEILGEFSLDPERSVAVLVYHSVVQTSDTMYREVHFILDAFEKYGIQLVVLTPNSDAGGAGIRAVYAERKSIDMRLYDHLPRERYLALLACADLLVGNSSSGIIEAASLGIPVVNIGSRQNNRDRNPNVLDVPNVIVEEIEQAIGKALSMGRGKWENVYGDGKTAQRIHRLLGELPLDRSILMKSNTY